MRYAELAAFHLGARDGRKRDCREHYGREQRPAGRACGHDMRNV
jgi:hypothetical protein